MVQHAGMDVGACRRRRAVAEPEPEPAWHRRLELCSHHLQQATVQLWSHTDSSAAFGTVVSGDSAAGVPGALNRAELLAFRRDGFLVKPALIAAELLAPAIEHVWAHALAAVPRARPVEWAGAHRRWLASPQPKYTPQPVFLTADMPVRPHAGPECALTPPSASHVRTASRPD